MKGKAIQSEAGNITVLADGGTLLIWVGGECYIVDNPAVSDNATDIEFSNAQTPDQIKCIIDDAIKSQIRRVTIKLEMSN